MIDFLLNLADPWGYVIVGLLVAGEAAAFIGLLLPGETAAFLGGVLAFEGRVSLTVMLIVACLSAIIGDTIGYQVGKLLGPRMREGWLGRRVGQERWDRASSFLRRYGGRAVFLGRWIGVLRALVPSMSGAAGIPYRVFLFFNVLGGVTWACTFVALGYAAGSSWRTVERLMGQATLLVVGILCFVALVVLGAKWASSHRDQIAAWRDALLEQRFVASFRKRFRPQIDFVRHRLDPGERFGLYLTFGVILVVLGAWVFGAVLQDVVAHDELALVDRPISTWLIDHRTAWLNTTMKVVTFFGSFWWVVGAAIFFAAASTLLRRSVRWPVLFILSVGGAEILFRVAKFLVGRPRPHIAPLAAAAGSSFPSGHAVTSTVLFGAVAYFLARRRRWKTSVWIWTGAVMASSLVAFSRVYLGVHWFTDVVGGFFLGILWLAVTVMATALLGPSQAGRSGLGRVAKLDRDVEPRKAEVS